MTAATLLCGQSRKGARVEHRRAWGRLPSAALLFLGTHWHELEVEQVAGLLLPSGCRVPDDAATLQGCHGGGQGDHDRNSSQREARHRCLWQSDPSDGQEQRQDARRPGAAVRRTRASPRRAQLVSIARRRQHGGARGDEACGTDEHRPVKDTLDALVATLHAASLEVVFTSVPARLEQRRRRANSAIMRCPREVCVAHHQPDRPHARILGKIRPAVFPCIHIHSGEVVPVGLHRLNLLSSYSFRQCQGRIKLLQREGLGDSCLAELQELLRLIELLALQRAALH
mmetsp:Transcript_89255/g.257406  ORF Transcript_89255/g.257406 Transcript_89255/m.257406 type:complete len:285 (-) Transcript_89255:298-1152(-)